MTQSSLHRSDLSALLAREQRRKGGLGKVLKRGFWGVIAVSVFIASLRTAEVSLQALWPTFRTPTVTSSVPPG
jgi:hypothetical protein